jgi:prevent-host-death family protein
MRSQVCLGLRTGFPLSRSPCIYGSKDIIDIVEAAEHLPRLVERAGAGEEIIIAKAGRPVARLVSLAKRTTPRPLGLLAGQVRVGPDFDDPLPDGFAA